MRVDILPPSASVPAAVAAPIVVRSFEDPCLDRLVITLADGGEWALPRTEIANMSREDLQGEIGEVFDRYARRFEFVRRVRIERRPAWRR